MAQHIELKNGKIKKYVTDIFNDYFENYGYLKPVKQGNDYSVYNYRGMEFTELVSNEGNRNVIEIPRNKMPIEYSKWIENTFFAGDKWSSYTFEYNKVGRGYKFYFVA